MNRFIPLLFAIPFAFISCKQDCLCTEKACICEELFISITANADNALSGSYSSSEIDQFYIIRTQKDFSVVDSIKLEFNEIGGSTSYNRYFRLQAANFPVFSSFEDYNYLIVNRNIASIDTLSNITYSEQMIARVCNECSPCDDETITCTDYFNKSAELNGVLINSYSLHLSKN